MPCLGSINLHKFCRSCLYVSVFFYGSEVWTHSSPTVNPSSYGLLWDVAITPAANGELLMSSSFLLDIRLLPASATSWSSTLSRLWHLEMFLTWTVYPLNSPPARPSTEHRISSAALMVCS